MNEQKIQVSSMYGIVNNTELDTDANKEEVVLTDDEVVEIYTGPGKPMVCGFLG